MEVRVNPASELNGEISVPGDKSISHRAVMFGALAEGVTEVSGFLPGEDCLSTIACFRELGIEIEQPEPTSLTIYGKGLAGLHEPSTVLDVGNSGTTIRLLLGILSGQSFYSALTGDSTIRKRPMGRVTTPLRSMGAQIYGRENGSLAPLAVQGKALTAIEYDSPVASAQVKSAILLAGLYASGTTVVREPHKSRDHTERMLKAFGADVEIDGNNVAVKGSPKLTAQSIAVPGDISSAAFFLVAGSIANAGSLHLNNVGINPTRDGILEVLLAMGARIELKNRREVSGEPVADLIVHPSQLTGLKIGGSIIPRLIDEIPVLAVAAAYAHGVTEIRDAAELKVKETNRISAVACELSKLGVKVEELPDGLRITGTKPQGGTTINTYHDHRMAMAMAVAALGTKEGLLIRNA
ncbi:MAG TPA: 3-phosphoshikimate 1-carboxyvinyltransferase, partial [Candidatus Deferrimicrobium sp.]|nr:3-phosphoshikimate 1-carboxyvinyltransferase [Candidatus Deferrimicrobium sp.]